MEEINTVYIAGPMTGIPDHNKPGFDDAVNAATTYFPAKTWIITPFYKPLPDNRTDGVLSDIDMLSKCDAIVLIPGWSRSRGAVAELLIAASAEIDIFVYDPIDHIIRRIEWGIER